MASMPGRILQGLPGTGGDIMEFETMFGGDKLLFLPFPSCGGPKSPDLG